MLIPDVIRLTKVCYDKLSMFTTLYLNFEMNGARAKVVVYLTILLKLINKYFNKCK